jgi:hypothetical protein
MKKGDMMINFHLWLIMIIVVIHPEPFQTLVSKPHILTASLINYQASHLLDQL